jgi:pimeloyl-ACP methyl ester carboxylesterase
MTSASRSSSAPSDGLAAAVKQIDAGDLDVGYVDIGPAGGRAVLLLHGWPYDIHSFAEVVPILADAGYRVVVPHLRGYGSTRFLSDDTVRNGQQAALAADAVALLDALEIPEAIVGGFDWGARTAAIVAALWPERCTGLVSVSGYLIGSREANRKPLPPPAELAWWYQFYFATERGRLGYELYRAEFARLIWRTASPRWAFRRSHSRATRTARRTPTQRRTARNSAVLTPIGSLPEASAITCRRKRRARSPTR